MIDINNITVRIGSKILLENTSAHIADGQKVGLIGVNGCGKSTLIRVLQGDLETQRGDIFFPNSYKVAFVAQELQDIQRPVLEYVLAQDKELHFLTEWLKTASNMELPEIHERLNNIDADAAPARAAAILHGLGFKNDDLKRPVSEFSGGWRMRLALAAVLFQPSDILLLDEPTNHLDLEASIWLENYLKKYRGTLILISHDKNILNVLCNTIIHIEGKKLNIYGGNYDTFVQTCAMQRDLQSKMIERQEQKRRHLQSYVDRFRYKASKAKQAQSRLKMLAKLQEIPPLENESSSYFSFPQPPNVSNPLLSLENVSVGYEPNKPILQKLTFKIEENDRIALLGANGNGKSTLAKLITGKLNPFEGEIHRSPKLTVGYFAQHQSEELPLNQTAAAYMSCLMPGSLESKVRAHLARFGLTQEKALTQIEKLSGGEKARLLFAAMSVHAPSLLILDEPTNHLDIAGRESLVDALNAYTGSVLLITHDLNLIELACDTLWLVKGGQCKPFAGDLADYQTYLLNDDHFKVHKEKNHKSKGVKPVAPKQTLSYMEIKNIKGQLTRLEKKMTDLTNQKKNLELTFQTPLTAEQIVQTQKDLTWITAELNDIENEWLRLSELLQ